VLKKRGVRDLVQKEAADMICVQETKLGVIDSSLCNVLCGNTEYKFVFKASEGASGGLLVMWHSDSFIISESFEGSHIIGVKGH
jgi:exonuclease III